MPVVEIQNISAEIVDSSEPIHVSIAPFGFPKLPFSLLLSTSVCNPIATISAVLCFLDIGMLWCKYQLHTSNYHHLRHPFSYHHIFINFIVHFADAKLFHYWSILCEQSFELFCYLLVFICRDSMLALMFIIPSKMKDDLEAAFPRSFRRKRFRELLFPSGAKIRLALWVVCIGGGLGLWIGIACFFVLYNLITIQIGWLLAIIFGGGGN